MYSPEIITQRNNTKTDDNYGPSHEAYVASKALGLTNGVSKNAHLIVVNIAFPILTSDLAWAFDSIFSDIEARQQVIIHPVVVAFAVSTLKDPSLYP